MGKQSGYLARELEKRQALMDASFRTAQQLMLDTLQITLHTEFGFGYDRILRVTEKWGECFNVYHEALEGTEEADVWQERLDAALRDVLKDKQELIPFVKRYPDIKQYSYDRPIRRK